MKIFESLVKFITDVIKWYFLIWGFIILFVIGVIGNILIGFLQILTPALIVFSIVLGIFIILFIFKLLITVCPIFCPEIFGLWTILFAGLPLLILGAYFTATLNLWFGIAIIFAALIIMDLCYMKVLLQRIREQEADSKKTSPKSKSKKENIAESKEPSKQGIGFIELITHNPKHPNDKINKILLILQHPSLYQILFFIEICTISALFFIPNLPKNTFIALTITAYTIGALLLNMLLFFITSLLIPQSK